MMMLMMKMLSVAVLVNEILSSDKGCSFMSYGIVPNETDPLCLLNSQLTNKFIGVSAEPHEH